MCVDVDAFVLVWLSVRRAGPERRGFQRAQPEVSDLVRMERSSSSATAAAVADGEGAPAKSPEIAEPSDAAHCRSRAASAFSSSSPYAAAIGTRGGSSGGSRKSCGGGRAVVEGIYIAP